MFGKRWGIFWALRNTARGHTSLVGARDFTILFIISCQFSNQEIILAVNRTAYCTYCSTGLDVPSDGLREKETIDFP